MSENLRHAAAAHLERADEALESAQALLHIEHVPDSISRAYYAVFHAASATLAIVGEAPRTHRGTHDRFWKRFVKPGTFPRSLGMLFSQAQDMRQQADYDVFSRYEVAAAADLLRDVAAFVEEAKTLVQRLTAEAGE